MAKKIRKRATAGKNIVPKKNWSSLKPPKAGYKPKNELKCGGKK